ncbi:MAG: hypothetical protein WDM96_00405 [Lacunisphaera sp.]
MNSSFFLLPLAAVRAEAAPTASGLVLQLAPVDYLILGVYFAFVLGIGWCCAST